jgi:hypothetical protein
VLNPVCLELKSKRTLLNNIDKFYRKNSVRYKLGGRRYLVLLEELLENVAGVDPVVKGKDGVHLPVSLEKRNICKESKRLALANRIYFNSK